MRIRARIKQIISLILVMAQVSVAFAGCAGKGDGAEGGSIFDAFKKNFEVVFMLPDNVTEFDAAETSLPEKVTVEKDTRIGDLPAADRTSCIFVGYSYDPEGTKIADDNTIIDKDMTLYPIFETKEGMTNVFDLNFVSGEDVSANYNLDIATYGLTESEIREILTVKDLSIGGEEVSYNLISNGSAYLDNLGIPEKKVDYVRSAIEANRIDPDKDLLGTLDAMGLDLEVLSNVVMIYAPEERAELFEKYRNVLKEKGTQTVSDELLENILEIGTYTESELKEKYGLTEDDSLERYWREELGYEIEDVLRLSEIVKANSSFRETERYKITPEGEWAKGDLFQVEILNTERLRFVFGGEVCTEYITYYNFTVGREEVQNMTVDSGVVFLPLKEVEGVTLGSMFTVSVDENGESKVEEKEVNGTLTYKGEKALKEGSIVAVYDGVLHEDNSVDGETGYYEITKVLGDGKYEYVQANFQDVIAIPDVIPVSVNKVTDGATATVSKNDLKFDKDLMEVLGIDGDVTIDVGDYIAFYDGKLGDKVELEDSVGANLEYYAKVTSVSEKNGNTTFEFEIVPIEEIISSTDLHMKMGEIDPDLAEIDEEAIKSSMLEEIDRSRLVDEASDYLCTALLEDDADLDKYQNRDKLESMTFKTSEGEDITFEEVRKLASGGEKVKVDDVKVSFVVGSKLQHFEKKTGLRAEVTVSLKITISLGSAGSLEITPMIIFEQEVLISPMISVNAKWAYVLGFIPVMRYIDIDPTFECGTYTGFGLNVTIMTVGPESEDGEFSDLVNQYNDEAGDGKEKRKDVVKNLIKGGDTLKKMAELNKGASGKEWSKGDKGGNENENKDDDDGPMQDFNSPGVGGDLPTKYSGMLGNDAEYIDLVNVEIGTFATPVDPFHLVEFSIGAYFVVSFKLNAMIGTGVTYENAKRFTYHIRRYVAQEGEDEKSSGQADLATPNFRADFYAFGMIGIRVGIRIDVRLGLISTKLASIGVTAEVGVYAEVYGFLYVWYEWTSGKGSTSGAMGSLYFEIGIYVEINFVAQLGDGQFSTGFTIYENTWPLVQLGAEFVPLDFTVEKGDDCLSIEYEEGENTVTMPDDLYNINMMEMKSGEVSEENMDDTASVGDGKSFTMRGRTYTQYDEEHFIVECHDTDKDGNRLETCSFIYLPATNEVRVKPADTLAEEVWGEVTLTYKNDTFGFNTMKIQRTVSLHWQGTPATATVEYYIEKEPGSGEYELKDEGEFDGFNGVEYDLIVDEDFTYKFDGYRLNWVEFADTGLFSERYQELIRLSQDAWDHYQKTMNPADYDEALEIAAKTEAAFRNYNNYGQNIVDTVENGEGTLYFLMASSDTVVKVYYNHIVNEIAWRVWGDPNAEGEAGGLISFGQVTDVPANSKIEDYLGDARKVLDEYKAAVTLDKVEFYSAKEKDKVQALTDKSVMGKESIFVDFYANANTYKLSWVCDGDTIKTEDVKAFSRFTPEMPDPEFEEGYTLKCWSMKELNDATGFRGYRPDEYEEGTYYIMPAKDAKIVAEIEPQSYPAEWYYGDRKFATAMIPYGTQLSGYRYFTAISTTGTDISWKMSDGTNSADFEDSMTMPAKNVRFDAVITERTGGSMKFMVGNKEVAKLEGEGGKEVVIPKYTDAQKEKDGYALRWVSDGTVKITYEPGRRVSMPYDDMTFRAEWYCANHRYDGGYILYHENCENSGAIRYTCLNCGETYEEKIEATGHRWDGGTITIMPTCSTEGLKVYTCHNCGETREEKLPTIGHRWDGGTLVRDSDCIHAKLYRYICENCNEEKTEEVGEASGVHNYSDITYTWNSDNSVVTAKAVCSVCGDVITEVVNTTVSNYVAPGLVTEGSATYTAEFSSSVFTKQVKTVSIAAGRLHKLYYYADYTSSDYTPYTGGSGGVMTITIPAGVTIDSDFPVSEIFSDVCAFAFVEGDVDYPSAVFRPQISAATRQTLENLTFGQLTGVDISVESWEHSGSAANIDDYGGAPATVRIVKEQ